MELKRIAGTIIKNYFHCKRQAYLYFYGLNFYNERVRLGEVMHQQVGSRELVFENIKVDDIKNGKIIEYKKSSSNFDGTFFQVLHYLRYFNSKGLRMSGVIKDSR